jgi:hypothetical protein
MKRISEGEKISLAECRRILNRDNNFYTDEEILIIRDWLYQLADFTIEYMQRKRVQSQNGIKK